MSTMPNRPAMALVAEHNEIEALTFVLQGEVFALEATLVREILDLSPTTVVPGARRFAAAVINFRGKVIPLADLRVVFGMETTPPTIDSRIVVIEIMLDGSSSLIGLLTDRVNEVTTLDLSQSEPPPSVGMRYRPEFIRCLVRHRGEFVIVPVLESIFAGRHSASKPQLATAI
jgi:purine-binding chemotaxis protein CheW